MTTKLLAASSAIQTAPSIHLQSAGLARSLSLLLLTLGMTPSALSQVYSVNAVGYVNVTLPGNPRQALIANPLNGTNNHLNTILPLPDNAEGTRILRWNVPSQSFGDPIEFIGGIGWNSSNPDPAWVVLPPGEGFYIQSAVASPSLVTFVGDVPQGILTQVVPAGISYLASMVPVTRPLGQAGAPGTHQFPAAEGDSVWLWDTASQTFTSYEFMEGLGWFPDDPVIGPAQGFVSMKTAPAFWPQHFVVNLAGSRLGSPAASLAIAWLGSGNVRITWPASEWKLQQATDVQGTWSFVPGNPASPYITPAIGARKFFRFIQTQTCVAISCPANTNLTGSGPTGTPVVFTATATNICTHTVVPVTCTPASGSPFPLGSTTVACLATNSGETATCTFTVTVLDSVPPQITCPSDVVVSAAPGQCEASVSFTVTATDNLDPAPTITCAPPSGSTFPVGRTTVLCTAWDASGNISTCSFIVSVYPTQLSPAGEIWTARESNRNWRPVASSADGTRLVGIVQGVPIFTSAATPVPLTNPPTILGATNLVVDATNPAGAVTTFSVTATNTCQPVVPVTCTPASDSTFPLGTNLVTCVAVDAFGVTNTATFTVTVLPTAPLFAGCSMPAPGQFRLQGTGTAGLTYTLQSSTNLVNWLDRTNIVAAPSGLIEHLEFTSPDVPVCFYRLRWP